VDARDKRGHDGECGAFDYMRHCERSEAIHRAATQKVDCFVASLLAMTVFIK
jgi:hypothetical protein